MNAAFLRIDEFVNNAGTKSFGTSRSVLNDPSLQPPKPGENYLDKTLAAFGIDLNQPQGLGGSLGRALGTNPSMNQDLSNALVRGGFAAMASPPTVGVKGFPGAMLSALNASGKGGLAALEGQQQDRTQAINLANAAMNQKLHETQIAKEQWEMKKPFPLGSHVEYHRDPVTQQLIAHNVQTVGVPDPSSPNGYREVTAPTTPGQGGTEPQNPVEIIKDAKDKNITGEAFLKTIPGEDADYVRDILAGREDMPAITRQNPQARVIQQYVRQADKNYDKAWFKDHQAWMKGEGKAGSARVAADTAIDHAGQLSEMIPNMSDSNLWVGSKTANRVRNWWRGAETNPQLAEWYANARPVADEVAAVYAASGGGRGSALADREAALADLDPALGHDALNANLAKYSHLIEFKTKALQNEHRRGVGPWAEIPPVISKESEQTVERLRSRHPDAVKQATKEQAEAAGYEKTAVDSKGHRIGKKDGKWFDVKTGEPVK